MSGLNDLKATLEELAPDARFVLDGRSDESILNSIYDYAKLIPFDADNSWADFFFMAENSPGKLAEIHGNSDLADGALLPQQAFLLAFLDVLKTPRALFNHLPAAHRELYYRGQLGLSEQRAKPDSVALSFQLSASSRGQFIPAGTLFDAGQDRNGAAIRYALDESLLVNRGEWTDLRWVLPGAKGTQLAATVYSREDKVEFPQYGLRLFDACDGQRTVMTGRMVAAALLAMPAGLRTITVTFAAALDVESLTSAQVSGTDSWLDLAVGKGSTTDSLIFTLQPEAAAIAAPQNLDGITVDTPLLKLGRDDGAQVPEITALSVAAAGSAEVHYSTDYGVDRLDSTSYPFGTSPVVASGFNLMAPGWCNRSESVVLTLTPQWIGLPTEGFPTWYSGYDYTPSNNNAFMVQPLLVSSTGSQPLSSTPGVKGDSAQALFESGTGTPVPAPLTIALPPLLTASPTGSSNPCDWPQWLRLELVNPDFGHQNYLKLAGTKVLNPPYTPQMKALSVNYTVTAQADDFVQYLLTPFGYASEIDPGDVSQSQLYLGLSGGKAGDTLSLFWQLESPQTLKINWQYLNQDNQWGSLNDTVVDGTRGLLGSGLWSALLPDDASADVAQMPAGRYWVRALINPPDSGGDTCAYPWFRGITVNSMTATLDAPETLDPGHFLQPLPAGTIARPVAPIPGIEGVEQPWPSIGGQPAETPIQFFQRVAQRLLHRERALTWQDMASLLKTRYANVFGVAIPPVDRITQLPAPTAQTLLVIPVNAKKDNQDRLRPKFSQAHLNDMATYLQTLASSWISIVLVNPTYRDVPIAYDVTFNVNPDYGYRKLQELLAQHYMPWAWDRQNGVTLGSTLDYYGIIAWIQQQSFVIRVNDMTLDSKKASCEAQESEVLVLTWAISPRTHSKAVA
ncbi:hypothetical protein [Paraburkholderia sp. GAS348]|uniref:hypothetical protein n=1 Tax=Paraburkholderia sp. GAS348 TaxID=3035132 RepID=UPI003D220E32